MTPLRSTVLVGLLSPPGYTPRMRTPSSETRALLEHVQRLLPKGPVALRHRLTQLFSGHRDATHDPLYPAVQRASSELAQRALSASHRELQDLSDTPHGRLVLSAWMKARISDRNVRMAHLFEALPLDLADHLATLRFVHGPLRDALASIPQTAGPAWLQPAYRNRAAWLVARAYQSGVSAPALAAAFRNPITARWLFFEASQGDLWSRALAARLAFLASGGITPRLLLDGPRFVQDLARLAQHPESVVWIPAVRAVGRLATSLPDIEALLLHWLESDNLGIRRRSLTALASIPGLAEARLQKRLTDLVQPGADPHELAALGPAIPTLAAEWPEHWMGVASSLVSHPHLSVVSAACEGLLILASDGTCSAETARLLELAGHRADEPPGSHMDAAHQFLISRRVHRALTINIAEDDIEGWRALFVEDALRSASPWNAAERLIERCRAALHDGWSAMTRPADDASLGTALGRFEQASLTLGLAPWLHLTSQPQGDPLREQDLALREQLSHDLNAFFDQNRFGFGPTRAVLRAIGRAMDAPAPYTAGATTVRGEAIAMAIHLLQQGPWRVGHRAQKKSRRRHRLHIANVLWRAADAFAAGLDPFDGIRRLCAWWALFEGPDDLVSLLQRSDLSGVDPQHFAALAEDTTRLRDLLSDADLLHLAAWWSQLCALLERFALSGTVLEGSLEGLVAVLAHITQLSLKAQPSLDARSAAFRALRRELRTLHSCRRDPCLAFWGPQAREHALRPRTPLTLSRALPPVGLVPEVAAHAGRVLAPLIETAIQWLISPPTDLELNTVALSRTLDVVKPTAQRKTVVESSQPALPAARSGPVSSSDVLALNASPIRLAEILDDMPPRMGGYEIDRKIGEGGQYVVFLVRRPDLNDRRFVLKVPRPDSVASFHLIDKEIRLLAQIHHPNVLGVVDRGEHEGFPFLVVDYIVGATLADFAAEGWTADDVRLRDLVRDTCAALGCLSRHGLIHRDLKPDNLFVRLELERNEHFDFRLHEGLMPIGTVLLDFGIAGVRALDSETRIAGTVGYMAPEQYAGEMHERTDIYALAAVIHWCLTGKPFFSELIESGVGLRKVAWEAMQKAPSLHLLEDTGVGGELLDLISRATRLNPDERPSPRELARDIMRM